MSRSLNPYNVTFDQEFYRFVTRAGAVYSCAINPVELDYPIQLSDFEFYSDRQTGPDPRVQVTVGSVMQDYFTTPDKALMYICDPVDGRWQARQRLFRQWHESTGQMFDLHNLEITMGDTEAHGGILVAKDFPYSEVPMLVDKAAGIVVKKFG